MSSHRARGLRPPPRRSALDDRLLHQVVRDHPEVLAPLRAAGLDVAGKGGESVGSLGTEIHRLVVKTTAWRPSPSTAGD